MTNARPVEQLLFKGVSCNSSGRYEARLMIGGCVQYIGSYDSEEEAARAYDATASETFGDFAKLNFPVNR